MALIRSTRIRSTRAPVFARRALILAALVASSAFAVAAQQRDAAGVVPSAASTEKSAAQLYEEAAGYTRRKYAELEREGFRYEPKLAAEVEGEQRALAARNAAQLSQRGARTPDERFYLGQLQSLAGESARAVETMRAFLRETPAATREQQQAARFVVALQLAKKGTLAEESEAALAEYLAHDTPPSYERRYSLEMEFARSARERGLRESVIEHARAALEAAKQLTATETLDAPTRDELFYRAGQTLAETLNELNQTGEAIGVLQELRRLSVSFPSADLYRRSTLLLGRIVPAVGYMTKPDDPLFAADKGARLAPEIEVKDWIDQKPTTLAAERGRVVLLDFWATWCVPCQAALPSMSEWQKKYKERGLTIIAFTQYHDEMVNGRAVKTKAELDELRGFRRANRLPFGVAAADTLTTAARYNVTSIPAAILIDRRGVVRYLSVGSNSDDLKELEQMIVRLLDEPTQEAAGIQH